MSFLFSVFWLSTIFLLALSLIFIFYWIKDWPLRGIMGIFLVSVSYGLYLHWGASRYLKQYYLESNRELRAKQIELRILLTEFKKTEFKLRQHLEENPHDPEAEWRLLDVLAIKALQNQDFELAIQYWDEVLIKMPRGEETQKNRNRIFNLLQTLKRRS